MLVISITWGTIRIYELEQILGQTTAYEEDPGWSFGQILPVLLTAGPILILIRSAWEAVSSGMDSKMPSILQGLSANGSKG